MRVTIIRETGFVRVDGIGLLVDLSFMDASIRSINWFNDHGEIEWLDNDKTTITSTATFQPAVDAWQIAFAAENAAAAPDPTAVPQEVSPYQARVALLQAGHLDAVESLMANPATPQEARIAWEYATTVRRQSAFIATLGPLLGLTDEQIDNLFRLAASID